ncbi:protein trichome birefringence-like 19 [Phragmites australis]|uniref:protein trichome birefringence-like 19 n=1 Tax=Phragmites australis TaxID=29695 RepID=UPI002D779E33|nr:protein trichome birefringence-like 19 [Phragmites australis]
MKTLPMIPSIRGLLTGDRRGRHAVPRAASVPALLFFAVATFSVFFLRSFQWSPIFSFGSATCDPTRGQWVRDPDARPYYTNATCAFIEGYQNCMKHGKPSLEFLRWRWRPYGCGELERFDAARFFGLVRGRSILFVGDSLASSHVRSLVCVLSQVEKPARSRAGSFDHWRFPAHEFAVVFFWTPFQVRWRLTRGPPLAVGPDRQGEVFAGPSDLHLDEPDQRWTSAARDHDYVVVSASHWFARPAVYYRGGRAVGCHGCCVTGNVTALKPQYAQQAAFRTVLRTLAGMDGFRGTAILRTVAPTHYENGGWFDGGECTATQPTDPEDPAEVAEPEAEFYRAQVEEFKAAEQLARRNGVRLRLMDVTKIMLRRPDGHPDRYGHGPGEHDGFDIDCLHWCLPGPIDLWNELLIQILARG